MSFVSSPGSTGSLSRDLHHSLDRSPFNCSSLIKQQHKLLSQLSTHRNARSIISCSQSSDCMTDKESSFSQSTSSSDDSLFDITNEEVNSHDNSYLSSSSHTSILDAINVSQDSDILITSTTSIHSQHQECKDCSESLVFQYNDDDHKRKRDEHNTSTTTNKLKKTRCGNILEAARVRKMSQAPDLPRLYRQKQTQLEWAVEEMMQKKNYRDDGDNDVVFFEDPEGDDPVEMYAELYDY